MRLLSALDRYVTQLRADGRSIHTVGQYCRYIRCLDGWLRARRRSRDVRTITAETLAEFLTSPAARVRPDGKPKREVSVNALRSSLRAFFAYCQAAGYASRNAAQLVRRARCASPPPRALPEADCRRLLATLAAAKGPIARRDEIFVRLMLTTGIRLGSALAIETADVDLRHGELTLRRTKGDRPDRIAVPLGLRSVLKAFLATQAPGPLFVGSPGHSLSARQARRRFCHWVRLAGIRQPASPHSLRHSFATIMYRHNRDIAAVQQHLRHRSIQSTMIYAHLARAPGGSRLPRIAVPNPLR